MNELELKTLDLQPAKIEFNKDAIINDLNDTLKHYKGLVFTEDTAKDARKVMADLRKGKKSADEFRKNIKKKASEPIKEFENEMKEIDKLFDDIINPINEQHKEFEAHRKEKKRVKVQEIIANVLNEIELEQKYADRLEILDEYLNKSFSINQL